VTARLCEACGVAFEGHGLRKYCDGCNDGRGHVRGNRTELTCVECEAAFVGRPDRVVCSRRCGDARYARLHPAAFAAKRRHHDVRVADRRRRAELRELRREVRELRQRAILRGS